MKLGLGQSYDKVTILPVKARAWIDLTKPASTLGVMGAYGVGLVFYLYYQKQSPNIMGELDTIIYAVFTIGFAHAAAQALNMAEDAEMDKNTPHKQDRPIPSGIVSAEEARTIAWFLILMAVGRAYITNTTFGIFVTVLVIFGVFYNLEPIRAKERIISIPWQAASRGLLLFPTIWAVYGNPFEPLPWVFGLFTFFYVLGFQNSADIIDREVDEEYGVKTFVVVFGPENLKWIATACTLLMGLVLNFGITWNIIPERFFWMNLLMIFCIVMVAYMTVYPKKVSSWTANHPAWLWFYGGMVLSLLLPLVIEIQLG